MPQLKSIQPSSPDVLAQVLLAAAQNLKSSLKRKGEFAESFFQLRALALGFLVSRLWGDSAPADFHLEWPGRVSRIQVKSAWTLVKGGYKINTMTSHTVPAKRRTYSPNDIDFYAAIAMPIGATYIVPVRAVRPGQKCFFVFPDGPRRRRIDCRMPSYEKFRERWDLLQ
jgi:hypothetical protein